ncbi:MAG: hypothetical protein AB1489_41435, partial [Acidobacteriota bacterium]
NLKPVTAARAGNLILFRDRDVFRKPLDFTGQTTASFPFTLKGLKQFPMASIWVSSIRDDSGILNIAPAVAGIVGRVDTGAIPQIVKSSSAIFQNDDTVGVNIDGTDSDADTLAITLSFLDKSGRVVFALGIVGENGFQNFVPFQLELLRTPVRGKSSFNINFAINGISQVIKPGTLGAVAASLVDGKGNRSEEKVIPFSVATGL